MNLQLKIKIFHPKIILFYPIVRNMEFKEKMIYIFKKSLKIYARDNYPLTLQKK